MREEDEIRQAVIELARAQAAGEDIDEALPHGEIVVEAEAPAPEALPELSPEEQRDRAVAAVLDHVRAATRESRLAVPAEWAEAGLVPPSMTPEDLEMAVYDALMEYGDPLGTDKEVEAESSDSPAAEGAQKPGSAASSRPSANKHVKSAFSSSNGRPVGAMNFKAHKAAAPENPAEDNDAKKAIAGKDPAGNDGARENAFGKDPGGSDLGCPSSSEVDPQAEGGPRPAPTEDNPEASPLAVSCAGIRLLMGAESYYLYDSAAMTNSYARWAFLAAEDDPVTTFIECVREESSVYPRPMAITSLANDPFCLEASVVEQLFAEARAQGRADDVERTQASNGDVYFYSTTYLSPVQAHALAEWDAVERASNV